MKTIILLIALTMPLESFGQYRTDTTQTKVNVYGLENHKKRKAVGRVMDVVGASGIVTYFILKEKYESNNLYMPEGVLWGSAGLLALGLTVELASLSKVGKPRKKRVQTMQEDETASPPIVQEDKRNEHRATDAPLTAYDTTVENVIEIHGLDRFKKQATAGKVFQILGASALLFYFVAQSEYNNQIQSYLKSSNPGSNPPKPPSVLIPALGSGVMAVGLIIDIDSINSLTGAK